MAGNAIKNYIMPFTLAHPAIVLPLKYLPKKWISMTALIVGSVMPDFEAFIRMHGAKSLTHSWPGFFMFGLPLGILITFVFHNIVRDPLIANLPSFLRRRFSTFTNFNWNKRFSSNWPVVILSMVIGGASHFFWDGFSHFDGWVINRFPRLKGNIYFFQRELEIPYLIQYINSLLGIVILIVFILILPREKKTNPQGNFIKFWGVVILVALIIFIPRIIYMPQNIIDDLLFAVMASLLYAITLAAVVFNKKLSTKSYR